MEYFPSISVTVPAVVPFTTMEVPGRVSFVSEEVTVPVMVRSCPKEYKIKVSRNIEIIPDLLLRKILKKGLIFFINVNLYYNFNYLEYFKMQVPISQFAL